MMIGMAKTGIYGVGTLVVPIMAFLFGGMPSSGIVLPMLVMADVFGVIYYHRSANWNTIFRVLPWAIAGILAGLVVGRRISADQFKQLMGGLVIFSLAIVIWQETAMKRTESPVPPGKWFAAIFGMAGGFSTMIGNAAGPVMAVYLLAANRNKQEFIGTAAWFFFIVNILKLPLQIWGWQNITGQTLVINFLLLPAIAMGAWAGIRITGWIPERTYRWFVASATFISAVALFFW